MHNSSPFLKWAGGKTKLAPQILKKISLHIIPEEPIHYYEPFLGSGAIFFALAKKFSIKTAILSDINSSLIDSYRMIKDNPTILIKELLEIQKLYHSLTKSGKKIYYYKQRALYNNSTSPHDKAILFLFLNKTCFNGLYRENSKGKFNVPQGSYMKPTIVNPENIYEISSLLNKIDVQLLHADYTEIEQHILPTPNSLVYLDPPYRPLSKTSTFNTYSKKPFNDNAQIQLAEFYTRLHHKNIFCLLSNSDPKNIDKNDSFFDDLYKEYTIERLYATRLVNSNPTKRGLIAELFISSR